MIGRYYIIFAYYSNIKNLKNNYKKIKYKKEIIYKIINYFLNVKIHTDLEYFYIKIFFLYITICILNIILITLHIKSIFLKN